MADLRKAELFPADAFGLFYLHQPRNMTGTSVYRYLMQQRLHAVCELLEQGTVPNEAYLLCDFKDYANFYRAFRSAYG